MSDRVVRCFPACLFPYLFYLIRVDPIELCNRDVGDSFKPVSSRLRDRELYTLTSKVGLFPTFLGEGRLCVSRSLFIVGDDEKELQKMVAP